MPTRTVLCADCDREKQLLEAGGMVRVLSCVPDADARFCTLTYDFNFVAKEVSSAAPTGLKVGAAKKAPSKKQVKSATKKQPAAKKKKE